MRVSWNVVVVRQLHIPALENNHLYTFFYSGEGKINGMYFKKFFQPDIFLVFYRFILPIVLIVLFFVIPWLNSTINNYKAFDLIISLFIIAMLSCAYSSVTFLDEVPSKRSTWLRLWTRFGTFKENKFLPYFDRSSLRYIYYLNAIGASATTSMVLGYMLIINDIFSGVISSVIGIINFFLLFIPFAFQYRVFERAIYSSDLTIEQVANFNE